MGERASTRPGWRRRAGATVRGRPGALALAATALAAVVYLAPALFSDRVFAGDDLLLAEPPQAQVAPPGYDGPSNPLTFDSAYVFHPDLIAARRAVRSGELPVWSPNVGAGRSLLAGQQAAPLYPANWLAYVGDFWTSLEWTALLKLLVAGGGMLVLLRDLRLAWLAATFGAVSYTLSTYLLDWLAHPHSNVLVLAPLLVALAGRTATAGRVRDAAGLAAVLGLALLGGHPPTLLLVGAVVAGPYALAFALREPGAGVRRPGAAARRLALLAGGVAVGLAAGGVMALPFAEGLGVASESGERGGTWIARSAANSLFFPELWGRPGVLAIAGEPSNFQERTAYFGAAPLLLALAGLVARRPAQAQVVLAACGLAALGLAFAEGFSEAVHELPGFGATNLWRALGLAALCGTALAAFGVQRLLDGSRAERLRVLAVVVLAGAAIPVQWVVRNSSALDAFGDALDHLPAMSETPAVPAAVQLSEALGFGLLALATAVAAALALWRPARAPIAVAALLAITAADLIAVGRFVPIAERARVDIRTPDITALFAERARRGERSGAEDTMLGPNLANRWDTLDARAHALPPVDRYQRVWLHTGGEAAGNQSQRSHYPVAPTTDGVLDIFSVRWLTSTQLEGQDPQARRYRRVPGLSHWPVWENLDAHPRARVVTTWLPVEGIDTATSATISREARALLRRPTIEDAGPPPADGGRLGSARIVSESQTEVRLEVDAPARGYAVLNDLHYPGWKATVDGREVPLRAANVTFRAAEVPAGRHEVAFRYESGAVRWGLVLSGLAWVAIGAALALPALRRRRRRAM